MVHYNAKIFGPPYSPFSCGVQYKVSFKSGNEKIIKKSIPDSVKYSLGLFDQCKQPQWYSSLELSFLFFLEMIFCMNCCHNGNPTGSWVVQYIPKTLILYVCMYVPEIQPKRYTIAQKFQCHLTHHSPAVCSIKFRSNWETKKLLKNQFPIQSSTLREYLINANNLSGIVRWSYLFVFS